MPERYKEKSNPDEFHSKHTLTIEFGDGLSIELPYIEKQVEFPEHTVQETGGVKGYTRKRVAWEDLGKAFEHFLSFEDIKRLGLIDLEIDPPAPALAETYATSEEYESAKEALLEKKLQGIESLDSISSLDSFKLLQNILHTWKNPTEEQQEAVIKKFGAEKWGELSTKIQNALLFLNKILEKLGDDFPYKTNLHVMQQVWGLAGEEASEAFQKELLLQRVFDPALMVLLKAAGKSHVGYQVYSSEKPFQLVAHDFDMPKDSVPNANTEKSKTFLLADRGLSVSNTGVWGADRDGSVKNFGVSFFGFGKDNSVYIEYLKRCSGLLREMIAENQASIGRHANPAYEYLKILLSSTDDLLARGESSAYTLNSDNPHPVIPCIIGRSDIPELRWCHASYAYVPSANGMNFIKMKA